MKSPHALHQINPCDGFLSYSRPTDDKRTIELEDRCDMTLERFLRARGFDVPVSSALFIEHRCAHHSVPPNFAIPHPSCVPIDVRSLSKPS